MILRMIFIIHKGSDKTIHEVWPMVNPGECLQILNQTLDLEILKIPFGITLVSACAEIYGEIVLSPNSSLYMSKIKSQYFVTAWKGPFYFHSFHMLPPWKNKWSQKMLGFFSSFRRHRYESELYSIEENKDEN